MAYRDFQQFLDVLREKGELRRIDEPLSPYLEITEVADRVMKSGGPGLLITNPAGPPHRYGTPNPQSAVMNQPSIDPAARPDGPVRRYEHPVAINTLGSRRRMSLALGVEDYSEHAERIRGLIEIDLPKNPLEALKMLPSVMGQLVHVPPKTVRSGICQEVVMKGDEVDLGKLPVLTCWPEDGGPFITLPLVFSHDPNTGRRGVGMYRLQVYDRNTCGMHWQIHKSGMRHMEDAGVKGQRIEVAVVLGGDPAYTFSALAPMPHGVDEMMLAGFLRRKSAELVPCKTVQLKVPADAEIVLEGYVDPQERRLEGPFGDHTGYYSLAEDFPVFHVTCVTMRERAVYPATIVGQPPMEDAWMGKAVETIFFPLIKLNLHELVAMNLPVEGGFHNIAFVSFKKRYPGHAYKVMSALWGMGGLTFTKFIFCFDEDVDVHDIGQVLFRLGANCDPMRDTLLTRGPVDQLDHASIGPSFGGKIGFDCTHKWPGENGFSRPYPKLIQMSEDVKKKIDGLWGQIMQ